jgi:hypothetical protein
MSEIKQLFSERKSKEQLLNFIKTTENGFQSVLEFSIYVKEENAWRAAWIICHAMKKNDSRVFPYIKDLIDAIPNKTDGHQRQLLIILEKMNISVDDEGYLFDHCLSIWEAINKIPSTRITAFKILAKIAKKHPDLLSELELWTSDYYTETLSAGIKNSLEKIKNGLLQFQKL